MDRKEYFAPVHSRSNSQQTSTIDPHMAAAAHDMYEALRTMILHANDPERYFQAVSDAVKALAKAEGRTEGL